MQVTIAIAIKRSKYLYISIYVWFLVSSITILYFCVVIEIQLVKIGAVNKIRVYGTSF